ncbi:hypothetical protein I5L01_04650 [Erythrobacter sp. YJ-T3-07]|uniref:hypothetical protein n=1 Tax=Erythrobacter sp. YJ-T3-07 TaxID=2793063 RepID=UPI0018D43E90|nr:hypothetical protein [Erythrobacter sp. YJ-T3-07]MBH1943518.1 hypothetical protein [Erythrobacter sp. YJ-T3-07]
MSFLIASGAAVLALTMQAHGTSAVPQTDSDAAVDACIGAVPQDVPPEQFPKADRAAMIGCAFRTAVDDISGQLPIKVDPDTTLVAISSSGPRLD